MIKKFNFNKLIIGTANFGQKYGLKNKKINQKEIFRILNYSHQIGIRTIDTANSYGNSEKILGKTKLKKWKVISKIPYTNSRSQICINLYWNFKIIKFIGAYIQLIVILKN